MRNKRFISILFILFLCGQFHTAGAGVKTTYDRCAVHVDKTFYVTGEVVWFKAFLPTILNLSNGVARAQLIDGQGNLLQSHYAKIDEFSSINGYFKIPFDIKSDIYFLVITVHEEDGNFAHHLVFHPLAIYNDLKVDFGEIKQEDEQSIFSQANTSDGLSVRADKNTYAKREKVTISVKLPEGTSLQKNNFSLAVAEEKLSGQSLSGLSNFSVGPVISESFEVDNEIAFRGKVVDQGKLPFEADFLAFVVEQEGLLRLFESYEDGSFELDLPFFEGKRNVQLVDYSRWDLTFTLEEEMEVPNEMKSLELVYNQTVLDYIRESQQRKKINQLFQQWEYGEFPKTPVIDNSFEADRSFEMDKLEFFPEMTTFFKQFTTPLKLKPRKNDVIEIKMVNPDNKPFYPGIPRFMINGNFIEDHNYAVRLGMKDIDRIDLFYFQDNLKRQFDYFGSRGVVAIYTKEKIREEVAEKTVNTFQIQGGIPEVDYMNVLPPVNTSTDKPKFRSLIYWNPKVKINENGEMEVSFFHSDDKGTFNVEVIGEYSGSTAYEVR